MEEKRNKKKNESSKLLKTHSAVLQRRALAMIQQLKSSFVIIMFETLNHDATHEACLSLPKKRVRNEREGKTRQKVLINTRREHAKKIHHSLILREVIKFN
jgi:hypothetical protein